MRRRNKKQSVLVLRRSKRKKKSSRKENWRTWPRRRKMKRSHRTRRTPFILRMNQEMISRAPSNSLTKSKT